MKKLSAAIAIGAALVGASGTTPTAAEQKYCYDTSRNKAPWANVNSYCFSHSRPAQSGPTSATDRAVPLSGDVELRVGDRFHVSHPRSGCADTLWAFGVVNLPGKWFRISRVVVQGGRIKRRWCNGRGEEVIDNYVYLETYVHPANGLTAVFQVKYNCLNQRGNACASPSRYTHSYFRLLSLSGSATSMKINDLSKLPR